MIHAMGVWVVRTTIIAVLLLAVVSQLLTDLTFAWILIVFAGVTIASLAVTYWQTISKSTSSDKDQKKSWPWKKIIVGGGVVALIMLLMWGDILYQTYRDSGFSFAEDTGLGRVLSEEYGINVANWLLIGAVLIILATILGISIGWKTIVTMIKAGLFIIVVYLAVDFGYNFWLEVSQGTPKYRAEQSQAEYPVIKKPSPPVDIWQTLNVTERTRVKVRLLDCHKLVVKPGGAVDGSLERNRSTIEFWAVQPLQYRMVYSSKPSGC